MTTYYNISTKSIEVKYDNPKKNIPKITKTITFTISLIKILNIIK